MWLHHRCAIAHNCLGQTLGIQWSTEESVCIMSSASPLWHFVIQCMKRSYFSDTRTNEWMNGWRDRPESWNSYLEILTEYLIKSLKILQVNHYFKSQLAHCEILWLLCTIIELSIKKYFIAPVLIHIISFDLKLSYDWEFL